MRTRRSGFLLLIAFEGEAIAALDHRSRAFGQALCQIAILERCVAALGGHVEAKQGTGTEGCEFCIEEPGKNLMVWHAGE